MRWFRIDVFAGLALALFMGPIGGCATARVQTDRGQIITAPQGPDSLRRARDLNAEVLQQLEQGRYLEGIPKAREALAIHEKALGPNHPDLAESLINLAALLQFTGDYAAARPLYQRALKIGEQTLGPNHPEVALSLNNLTGLYYAQGKFAEAEPLYRRSLAIREKVLGGEHPGIVQSLEHYVALLRSSTRRPGARVQVL